MIDKAIKEAKIIYEKVFPQEIIDIACSSLPESEGQEQVSKTNLKFDDIMEEIYDGVSYELLPERTKSAEQFIETVKQISDDYKLDVKIIQHYSHVSANFYFNSSGCMGFLKKVITFADEISFFANQRGYEIVLSIDHYTHIEKRYGRVIHP